MLAMSSQQSKSQYGLTLKLVVFMESAVAHESRPIRPRLAYPGKSVNQCASAQLQKNVIGCFSAF